MFAVPGDEPYEGDPHGDTGGRLRPLRWLGFLAALTVVQVVPTTLTSMHQPDRQPVDALGAALLLTGPLALFLAGPAPLLGRRLPVPVFLVTTAATLLYVGLGYGYGPFFLALVASIVGVVLAGHRLVAWVGLTAGVLAYYLAAWVGDPRTVTALGIAGHAAWVLIMVGFAELVRIRRERGAEAARIRLEERRRRASEQRLTIAQELHDVLAHNISLINVQAGVGLHLMDERPEQARTALSAIKQASAEALGELRSVLDVLRAGEDAPRSPAPGLAALQPLVDRAAAAGVEVRLSYEGDRRTLPVAVELAAYRLVQEALTNVVKHAAADTATVRVHYGDAVVAVTVEDDGRGTGASALPGSGSGIDGMRRRVAALGGTLEAGPIDGGGFRVRARIPVERRA